MSIDPQNDRGKASKAAAQYGPGGRDHCGICRYYLELSPQAKTGACNKVRGPIRPQDWCQFYERGTSREGATRVDTVPPLAAAARLDRIRAKQ
jgi:hypothetical protein